MERIEKATGLCILVGEEMFLSLGIDVCDFCAKIRAEMNVQGHRQLPSLHCPGLTSQSVFVLPSNNALHDPFCLLGLFWRLRPQHI